VSSLSSSTQRGISSLVICKSKNGIANLNIFRLSYSSWLSNYWWYQSSHDHCCHLYWTNHKDRRFIDSTLEKENEKCKPPRQTWCLHDDVTMISLLFIVLNFHWFTVLLYPSTELTVQNKKNRIGIYRLCSWALTS